MAFHIKIGNYRFSKNLGTGSFGKVKLAYNDVTGHKVAIKILNKKKIKQQGVFEKVKREIKVLRQFNHPHIIKHYEFIDTPSDIFMVIEFASGGELFDLISRRERLPEDEARRFFQQIYSSIEYTHAHKISHRDLKPENLLLDEYNNIKLIDFGLANSMKDSQSLKTACGSPNYAAPEVISGRSYGGVEVDVWSLGVILFAMVCGSMPFDDDSMSSLFNKIKEGKYLMPNYISADVKDLINRMLQPNPVKRISMREIKDHPWYLRDLPQYLQDLSRKHSKPQSELDMEIVRRLFTLNINLLGRTEEEICKSIKDKKNTDFCGIYELYFHDKMKKECFKIQHQYDDDPYESSGNLQVPSSGQSVSSASARKKHFRTVKHMLMHNDDDAGSRTPSSTMPANMASKDVQQQRFSLLSSKHTDRLSRIIKKFRAGDERRPSQPTLASPGKFEKAVGAGSLSQVSTKVETTAVLSTVQQQTKVPVDQESSSSLFIQRRPLMKQQKWVFGLSFKGTPIDLMNLACQVLKLLEIEWQIIPKDLKLKCRSRIDENSINEYEQSLLMDGCLQSEDMLANQNKDEMIKEFLRKNFLKFYINIYKDQAPAPSTSSSRSSMSGGANAASTSGIQQPQELEQVRSRYMVDVHLFKGTVYVFMDFIRKFMHAITASCSQCSGNSCGSSHSSVAEGASGCRYPSHHHDYNLKLFA